MTNWKKVRGSQEEKPKEWDTATSKVVVYQRKNIERITEDVDGKTTEIWQYDEREMSREEYAEARAEIQQAMLEQNRADIDFIMAMTDIDLQA